MELVQAIELAGAIEYISAVPLKQYLKFLIKSCLTFEIFVSSISPIFFFYSAYQYQAIFPQKDVPSCCSIYWSRKAILQAPK
jgi:hypothetical protein